MMKEKNIRELAKRMGLITVENMCQYTIPQLVLMVANKVNELIGEVGRFESDVVEVVKTQNENIKYLLDKGLIDDVTKVFDKWIKDGTFDTLINHSALKSVNERIDETNAQLSEDVNKINERFTQTRKFKPKFGVAPWWNDDQSETKIKSDVENFKKFGCEFVDIIVYVKYDQSVGFYTIHNLESQLFAYEKIIENGMKVNKIKFHQPTIRANDAYAHWDEYTVFMKNEVEKWAKAFEGKGIEYFTVLNEWKALFNDKSKESFVIELINIPKRYGFKCGVSNSWIDEAIKLSSNIKASVDFFCCNVYPRVSYNKQNTTLEESVESWKFYETQLKYLKSFGKPILISETGTPDKWESLSDPTDYTLDVNGTPANGKASEIVLYGIFNSKIQEYVDCVTWWYFKSLWNDRCKKMIHEYLGMEELSE